jgi:integrase
VADNKVLHRGIGRVVFFGPRAREALTPLLVGAGPDDPVFRFRPHRPGWLEALTSHRYREFVAAACVSAGVPVWTPNQLRHNRATELMDALEDDAAVAAVLGNSPEVTRRVYAHRAGETAARRIAEATG